MMKCHPISSIEYLTQSQKSIGPVTAYYTDSSMEPAGRWWCPNNWIRADGDIADSKSVARLAQGRHPVTGKAMVTGKGEQKRAGFDLTFSSPKSFSILWAVSSQQDRRRLEAMLMDSIRDTMEQIASEGLIEARRGKGGKTREAIKSPIAAIYLHRTSREGDPQLHGHSALMNFAMREDGTFGAVNNERILKEQMRLGAAFRLRLAERLEAAGVPVIADLDHGFRIRGDNPKLLNVFSKRRKTITAELKKQGIDRTKGHAEAADLASLATRGKKDDLPSPADLAKRWAKEIQAAGYQTGDSWSRMDGPQIERSIQTEHTAAKQIVADAIDEISKKQSLFERREIEALALVMAVGRSSSAAIQTAVDAAMTDANVVYTKRDELFTTNGIIREEREIAQIARSRQNEARSGFSTAATNLALNDDKFSDEQRAAIKHALSPHGVVVVEGGPGVGKTTCSAAILKACVQDKRRLILAAPSWTAAEILKTELKCNASYFAVDKLLYELKSGTLAFHHNDLILIDEAGMCSNSQIAALMRYAAKSGASVRLQGDSHQIASVSRGDPLSLIGRAIGGAEIRTIRRQKIEWMRAASMAAQKGNIKTAFEAYANNDAVTIATDADEAIETAATIFRESKGEAVAIAATNSTVAALNARLRMDAATIGLLTGPQITMKAIPRGQKNPKTAEAVDLPLRAGDRLIMGAEAKIGDLTLRNAARLTIRRIDQNGMIVLAIGENREISTTLSEIQRSGREGSAPIMQHAYATTINAAQGATWSKTIWLAGKEDSRSALVAMTRHTSTLDIVIDKASVPRSFDAEIMLDRTGMSDPSESIDERTDEQIIRTTGKCMEKILRPRNASDILGLPAQGQTIPRKARMSESQIRPDFTQLLPKRHGFRRDQMPDAPPGTTIVPAKTPAEGAETEAFKMLLKQIRDGQDEAAAKAQQRSRHDADANIDTAAADRRRFDAWIGNDDDTDGGAATMPQDQKPRRSSILDTLFNTDTEEAPPGKPQTPFQPTWRPPARPAPAHTTGTDDDYDNSAPGM
ncbi:MAG: hypothetical protein B7Z58_17590 [Acidiphilium sp. 37-64-53]|nr:MAG: hypothetical protein B7Z58_17590 [Acidiphilium sp. 37-64-53]